MKKYLAVLLAILMAVSAVSAAGLVTTQKASAAPTPPPEIYYKLTYGQDQTWTGRECNLHYTGVQATEGAFHIERSSGASASAKVSGGPGEKSINFAGVGVKFALDGISNWEVQKDTPVKVLIKMSYTLKASGGAPDPNAPTSAGQIYHIYGAGDEERFDAVYGQGTKDVKQVTYVYQYQYGQQLTVKDLVPYFENGNPYGEQGMRVTGYVVYPLTFQQASGSVTIDSITIDFLT